MSTRKVVGMVLIIICVIVIAFGDAGTEAIAPLIIFCTIGMILMLKKPRVKKEYIPQKGFINPYVDVSLYHHMTEFPKVNYDNVFLQPGEILIYASPAETFIEKEQFVGYSGGSAGVSVHVAKGVSVRTGSNKGKAIRQNVTKFNPGDYVITNKRILFVSQNDGFEFDVKKISAAKMVAKDAFIIIQGNKQKNFCIDNSQMQVAFGLTTYVVESRERDITNIVNFKREFIKSDSE